MDEHGMTVMAVERSRQCCSRVGLASEIIPTCVRGSFQVQASGCGRVW